MSDTTTPPAPDPPPDLSGLDQGTLSRLIAQLTGPQAQVPTAPAYNRADRGWVSLLGEAMGGGAQYGSTAEREQGGLAALAAFGARGLQASDYSRQPHTLGAIVGQGLEAAQGSLGRTQAVSAAQQQAAYEQNRQQQQDQLARIKEAIPLLTLQQQQKAADTARRIALGGNPPGGSIVTGGSLGSVDVPPEYLPFYQEASARTGIPAEVLIAQGRQESGFNPGATGAAGEIGIGQINPKTATDPGYGMTGLKNPDVLRDPRTNINFQADYLAARAKAAGADFSTPEGIAKALKAYNGGGDPNYVQNVTRYIPGARTALAPRPAPGQTAAATPPPPNAAPPPGPLPVPPIPPANPPPVVPTVQTAGPGAGNAPPGTPTAPVDPAAAPAQAPPLDLSTFQPVRGQLPPDSIYNPDLTPAEIAARTKQSQIEAVGLNPGDALAKIQGDIAAAQTAKRAAAEKAVQEFRANETTRQFEAAKLAAAERDKIAAEQRAAAQKEQQAQADHQRALDLEKQKSVFNIDQEGAKTAFQADKTQLDKMGETAAAMMPVGDQLRQLRPVMAGLPDAGFVSSVLGAYPGLTTAARMGGVVSPQEADNVQLFLGLTNHIAGQLRVSGSGSMSDKDLDTFKSTLPRLVQTQDGRVKAAAFLQNLSDRLVDEHDFAQQYFRRGVNGKPAYNLDNLRQAINAPRDVDAMGVNHGGLGPVIPQSPPLAGQSFDSVTKWIRDNVDVGHPYMGWGYPRDDSGKPMPTDPKTGKPNELVPELRVRER